MTRVGLVLGAGGTVGQAYQAGVLAALEHDLGWDPREAEVIVGTSAGSITGTLLRLGVPASELAAWAVRGPLSLEHEPVERWLTRERPPLPSLSAKHWARPWRLPSRRLVRRILRRPWAVRPAVAAMALMPTGQVNLTSHTRIPEDVHEEGWLEGLYICAARRDDGRRVVFGRPGAPDARVGEAVAASCAIPGYFAPVEIEGVEYFDGGVHSLTNADVLVRVKVDLVIAVSPMSAAGGRTRKADALLRVAAHRQLERELRPLLRQGSTVVRIEP